MPAFEYIGNVSAAEDELGIWEALPAATPRAFELAEVDNRPAFGADDTTLWQVTLPSERRAAQAALAAAGGRLAVAQAALPYAARRLTAFAAAGGPSPFLPPALESPEIALYDLAAAGQVGVGVMEQAGLAQVGAFFDKVRDTLRNYAAIDTRAGDQRVGLTLVSWTGDFTTMWPRGLALDDAQQHSAAVALALRTRDAWLRLGLTVTRGALQIATLFSLNPALALPATYRFVRQIIDQVQALGGFPALA